MERKLGEIFECNGVKLCVKEGIKSCVGCYFSKNNINCYQYNRDTGKCCGVGRIDNKSVIFEEIKDIEERAIKLTLEKAKEFYKKGGELKDLALLAFTEYELKGLPKTWEEFCKLYDIHFPNEYFIDPNSNTAIFPGGLGRDVNSCKNLLPTLETVEAHLALMQLHQLRDCYRQGWKPDWNDNCKAKYCIIRETSKDYRIMVFYNISAFLSFQSLEVAEEFLNNFMDLIIKAGDLI